MIRVAQSAHPGRDFEKIPFDGFVLQPADYVFASGIFQFEDPDDPLYYVDILKELFSLCRIAMVANFLSDNRLPEHKAHRELYLTDHQIVDLAASFGGHWIIDNSYHPGNGDITLALFKDTGAIWVRPTEGHEVATQ